jgi:hypothetical protein
MPQEIHDDDQRRHYDDDGMPHDGNGQYYPGEMEGGQEGHEGGEGSQVYVDHYEEDGNGGFSVTKKLVDSRLARK